MTQEDISWHILRLAAITSSICFALVGWFAHYFREEIRRLVQQQAAIQRDEKEARFLVGLAANIPIFVGLGAIFLVCAGSLSVWVAIDAAGLSKWALPSLLLFLVAVGAPFLTGIILFLALFADFLRSCKSAWEKFAEKTHIRKPTKIVLAIPDVPQGPTFDVRPDPGRFARWTASVAMLAEHSIQWGLGRAFMQEETNIQALRACATLAFRSVNATRVGDSIATDADIDRVEYKTQQIIDGVLDQAAVHRARLPVPLANLASAACKLAIEEG